MTTDAVAAQPISSGSTRKRFQIDKRYLAPILVTMVLIAGQVTFGFLESWGRTMLAICTAIGIELLLGKIFTGKIPHLASAYISGISIGMLVRSPEIWPYALCSAISITCMISTASRRACASRASTWAGTRRIGRRTPPSAPWSIARRRRTNSCC